MCVSGDGQKWQLGFAWQSKEKFDGKGKLYSINWWLPPPEMVPSMVMTPPLPWQFPSLFAGLHFFDPIAGEHRPPFNAGATQLIVVIFCYIGWQRCRGGDFLKIWIIFFYDIKILEFPLVQKFLLLPKFFEKNENLRNLLKLLHWWNRCGAASRCFACFLSNGCACCRC